MNRGRFMPGYRSSVDAPRRTAGRGLSLLRTLGVCAAAVAVLFLGYELIERIWLQGIDQGMLHTLHILRGCSAAAIAAMLATVMLLRGRADLDPAPGPRLDARVPWQRRLQGVSLRTKLVIPILALAVLPALLVGGFTISRARESLRESVSRRVAFDAAAKTQAIRQFCGLVQQDLVFLSQSRTIRSLAEAEGDRSAERTARLREEAERELIIFSQGKRAYYQVRYLNEAGREVVRLNVEHENLRVVPPSQLQDKIDRYYVRAALALQPGAIYVSPMDLNVEHGVIESPQRAVVRYATRVIGADGRGCGIVAINIDADFILSLVEPLPPGSEAWILDEDGTYLGYIGASAAQRGRIDLLRRRRISDDYAPEDAAAILSGRIAEHAVATRDALLSVASIPFADGAPARRWTLLVAHHRAPMEAPIRHLSVFLSIVTALIAAVACAVGFLIAHYLALPLARLRRATREIAAGDLDRRVEVTTGDEIEALAVDFNAMTAQLREARGQLARWNAELEREVARQTEALHGLQSGLARADRLASIGQMTAAVMHEVGNPLAAIKTTIQEAEEGDQLCAPCQAILGGVIKEVDRLAAFLRSFSRLARLRERKTEDVDLTHIAQELAILIGPEIRRRRLRLRIETAPDVPIIRGDRDQLCQLLLNLLLNAAQAERDGGEIVVRVRREGNAPVALAVIEVADDGAGIAPHIADRIWDPFFTTHPDGSGLGLAICREVALDHGGSIAFQGRPGGGTVFTATFPAGTGAWLDARSRSNEQPAGA